MEGCDGKDVKERTMQTWSTASTSRSRYRPSVTLVVVAWGRNSCSFTLLVRPHLTAAKLTCKPKSSNVNAKEAANARFGELRVLISI